MQVISVVRNFEMYNRLVKNNPFYGGSANFTAFDNNKENKYIPIRYNDFLKSYDYKKDDWFVFCHEDWELKEDLQPKLENLDKNCLYGPIGMTFGKLYKTSVMVGSIIQSDKNGECALRHGKKVDSEYSVSTFDCQCLIVHSSLINKYDLKFDELLSFDLYAEDFCINAKEKHNIDSKILPIECQHYSYGALSQRFYTLLKYLRNKYKNTNKIYITTVQGNVIAGSLLRFSYYGYLLLRKLFHFFYQSKITRKGYRIIKICKIPIFNKKVSNL